MNDEGILVDNSRVFLLVEDNPDDAFLVELEFRRSHAGNRKDLSVDANRLIEHFRAAAQLLVPKAVPQHHDRVPTRQSSAVSRK